MPKIRNIIIFIAIGAIFVLIYIFFIKPSPDQSNLVSSSTGTPTNVSPSGVVTTDGAGSSAIAQDFLNLLLNVKNIKLDDSIFADPAFSNLHDSSIVLVPDATTGRPNPFAQFGADAAVVAPVNPGVLNTTPPTNTPVVPAAPATPKSN